MAPTEKQSPDQQNVSKIEIGTLEAVLGVCVMLVGIGIAWGALRNSVSNINKTLDKNVVPDLKDVRERFGVVEDRVDTLWKDKYAPSHSPRQLNDYGQGVLNKSGIKEIVDNKRATLLELVRKEKPTNAYDAEEAVEKVMMEMPTHCPDIVDDLKQGAFKTGVEIGAVLFVGSIYLRNQIFDDLGFSLEQLDKPRDTHKSNGSTAQTARQFQGDKQDQDKE